MVIVIVTGLGQKMVRFSFLSVAVEVKLKEILFEWIKSRAYECQNKDMSEKVERAIKELVQVEH